MATEMPRNKVDAIYELRDAVEAKARAEQVLERDASAAARDALLTAQLDVEAKTQDAIEICHECGHTSGDGHAHPTTKPSHTPGQNVVYVDFRPDAEETS
jgi:hypothetical protein